MTELRDQAEAELRTVLGVRAQIEVVAPEVLPRTEFKARRVIDDHDLFASLKRRLGD